MGKVRFDLELSTEDLEALDDLLFRCNRSRKNMSESIILLALKTFKEGGNLISLDSLGIIDKRKGVEYDAGVSIVWDKTILDKIE